MQGISSLDVVGVVVGVLVVAVAVVFVATFVLTTPAPLGWSALSALGRSCLQQSSINKKQTVS